MFLSTLCTNNSMKRFILNQYTCTWQGLFEVLRRLPKEQSIHLPPNDNSSLPSISSSINFTLPYVRYAIISISNQDRIADVCRLIVKVMSQLQVLSLEDDISSAYAVRSEELDTYFRANTWKQFMEDIHTLRKINVNLSFSAYSIFEEHYFKYQDEMKSIGFFPTRR